ncbi:hypothetical protein A6R68_15425, partial [Neotoma lepida]
SEHSNSNTGRFQFHGLDQITPPPRVKRHFEGYLHCEITTTVALTRPGEDDVAPYFKTEPGLPQIHLEGNRLVLTCLAEGSWPLEFKWTRNDSELTAYSSEY